MFTTDGGVRRLRISPEFREGSDRRVHVVAGGISRRSFLGGSLLIGVAIPLGGCVSTLRYKGRQSLHRARLWPRFLLTRPSDELFLELEARGFREQRCFGRRWLRKVPGHRDPQLIFRIPPQHFAETAIPVCIIPEVLLESALERIELTSSVPGNLVFRIPLVIHTL